MSYVIAYFRMIYDALIVATFQDEKAQVEQMYKKRLCHYRLLRIDYATTEGYARIKHDIFLERIGVFMIPFMLISLLCCIWTRLDFVIIQWMILALTIYAVWPLNKKIKTIVNDEKMEFDDTGLDIRCCGLMNCMKSYEVVS